MKSIYDETPKSEIQNWVDSEKDNDKRVLAIDIEDLNCKIIIIFFANV